MKIIEERELEDKALLTKRDFGQFEEFVDQCLDRGYLDHSSPPFIFLKLTKKGADFIALYEEMLTLMGISNFKESTDFVDLI